MRTMLLVAALCTLVSSGFSEPERYRKGTLPAEMRAELRDAAKQVVYPRPFPFKFNPLNATAENKPDKDLRPAFSNHRMEVRDQGNRGTCSIFAVMTCVQFVLATKDKFHPGDFSPEYLNYVKNVANNLSQDGGFFSEIDKGYDGYSIFLESKVPYQSSFDPNYKVPQPDITAAEKWTRLKSDFVKDWDNTKGATDEEIKDVCDYLDKGIPVAAGFLWPDQGSFKTRAVQGVDVMVTPARSDVFDGHSIVLVGYKRSKAFAGGGYFIFRNSWGPDWGDHGYGYMPFRYVKSYCNDIIAYKP